MKKQKGWLARLVDMNDTTVSASTVFLLIVSTVAILLLLVPVVVLLDESFHNHTIATDMSGMAEYVAAVAGIFASGGILKGWTNYSNYRFKTRGKEKKDAEIEDSSEESN